MTPTAGFLFCAASGLLLTLGCRTGGTSATLADGSNNAANQALATAAKTILVKNCSKCHGADSPGFGTIRYIEDVAALVAHRRIKPGDPDDSQVWEAMSSNDMPPDGENIRPSPADIDLIRQWIAAGAPDVVSAADPSIHLLTFAQLETLMLADLTNVTTALQASTRYISLDQFLGRKAATGNDTLADPPTLQLFRIGVAKLLNSLASRNATIVLPQVVDKSFGALLRINLQDYNIDPAVWETLLATDPYHLPVATAAGQTLTQLTGTQFPVVRGDWFTETASQPPFYNQILGLAATMNATGALFNANLDTDITSGQVARSGFADSGVSINNRMIERHATTFGAFWVSYDFKTSVNQQNLFTFPVGPDRLLTNGTHGFIQNGGEAIFNLPNGLQAYLLVNQDGAVLDKAPIQIVSDPSRPDRNVVNGLSCMGCHTEGIKSKDDQLRPHVTADSASFTPDVIAIVNQTYPAKDAMQALYTQDANRFAKALALLQVDSAKPEPIKALALRFEADLDAPEAAAEAGLSLADFSSRLSGSVTLRQSMGELLQPGGLVKREVYKSSFQDLAKGLNLSSTSGGGTSTATSGQGFTCFANITGPSAFSQEVAATSTLSQDDASAQAVVNCEKFVADLPAFHCVASSRPCTSAATTP